MQNFFGFHQKSRLIKRLPEPIRFSETLEAPADRLLEAVRSLGLEGIIAKRRSSTYEAGRRSGSWVKFRVLQGRELVIAGYTPSGRSFDALLVGYYDNNQLIYVARELSATTELARLLVHHGRRDEAGAMLGRIYNWFTEGFETRHLKEAKALLEVLLN